MTVKKTGIYRINAWMDQHGQGGHYAIRDRRNGSDISRTRSSGTTTAGSRS